MKARVPAFALSSLAATLAALSPSVARASNVMEFPDSGSEQMGRGGAWIARASDPLATIFNPAGLAGQPTRITIQSNVLFDHTCFTRVKAAGDTTLQLSDGSNVDPLAPNGVYPQTCNEVTPAVSPQIAATIRLSNRLGLGLLVTGPNTSSKKAFPDFVKDGRGDLQPSPARYLLAEQAGLILFPTLGLGYEVIPNLRIGASFSWGFARLRLSSATLAVNEDYTNPNTGDVRATLQVKDYFVPGFTLGTLWSATPQLDVAAWYKWSDAIRAGGDVGTAANFYSQQNASGDDKKVVYGDTIFEDCGTGLKTTACGGGGNGHVKLVIPMEAKLGLRYHKPRAAVPAWAEGKPVRDPLTTDVFDLEANLTWANNSAADTIQIRFPGDATGKGTLPVAGVAGGEIPPNADQRRGFKDVVGIRLGGDWNVLPDRLALRAGGFFETSAAEARYQSLDFSAGARFGMALGATYRIRLGDDARSSALEIMAGFGHVFVTEQSRTDPRASGAPGLAGTSCNQSAGSNPPVNADTCTDGSGRYRTRWPVNLGTITSSLNVINVGLAYRF